MNSAEATWVRNEWESLVGIGHNPQMLRICRGLPDEPDFTPCQVPGCAEPLEYGQASLRTARCSQGHIWAELDGEFQLINQWRV